jgi:hypothetical protein
MNGAFLVGSQTASQFHRKAILAVALKGMERFVGDTERGFIVEYSHRQLRTDCDLNPYFYETFLKISQTITT